MKRFVITLRTILVLGLLSGLWFAFYLGDVEQQARQTAAMAR